MKTVIVWGDTTNKILNDFLDDGYTIIDAHRITNYASDDLGTYKNKGIIYTIEQTKNIKE